MYIFKNKISSEESKVASKILSENKIFELNGMKISCVALHDDNVVGAMSSGWVKSRIGSECFIEHQYSIAVDKDHRRKGIFKNMISIAVNEYNLNKDEVANKTGLSVISSAWVVNPFIEKEITKLGYSKISQFGENFKHYILQ